MTTPTLDRPLPPPSAPPPSAPPPVPPTGASPPTGDAPRPARSHGVRHALAIVVGCFALLPSFGLAAGGGAALVAHAVAADDDGWFHLTLDRVEADGVAVTADDGWFDDEADPDDAPWLIDALDVDVQVRVEGASASDEVFVGIARSADVRDYLDGAATSEVVGLDGRTPRSEVVDGSMVTLAPPATQDFWVVSDVGADRRVIEWDVRGDGWTAVVMNADGSPGVTADVEIGVRSGAVVPIGVTLLVVGAVGAIVSVVLIVVGVRGRRPVRSTSPFDRR